MTTFNDKIREVLKQQAANFLQTESNRTSLLTVTDCRITEDGKQAIIFFTVLPQSAEEIALAFTKRKRSDFRAYVAEHVKMRRLPFIDFRIDEGEKNRQRIDELLNESDMRDKEIRGDLDNDTKNMEDEEEKA